MTGCICAAYCRPPSCHRQDWEGQGLSYPATMYFHVVLPPTVLPPAILSQEVQLERIMLNIRSGRGGGKGLGFSPESSKEANYGFMIS